MLASIKILDETKDYDLPGGVVAEVAVCTEHMHRRTAAKGAPAQEQLDELRIPRILSEIWDWNWTAGNLAASNMKREPAFGIEEGKDTRNY